MPYDCATRRAGKCRFWCDYTTYGNMPDCYVPALINLTPYDGRKIDPDAVLVEYVHKNIANLNKTDLLYTEDYDVLYAGLHKPLTLSDVADILGKSEESAKLKVEKLVSNCLAYTYYDKKRLYVATTYYGKKQYEDYKLRGFKLL